MEVKYAKADATAVDIDKLKTEAREQLLQYATDPLVGETIGKARLRLLTIVFRTWELVDMEEVILFSK